MALNFPNSPADGDLATLNGTTFQYNAAKNLWDPVTEELTTTSDTPPGSPSNGQTWFDTTNGTLYVYYDDGTSSQWVGVTGPQGENATGGGTSGNTGSSSSVTTYSTISELPLIGNTTGDQAFVSGNNRLYLWNGNGWYNIALINTNPSITSVQDASNGTSPFVLTTDGTATVITVIASDPEEVPLTYSYSVTSGSLTNGGGTTATVSQGTGANTNVFTITPTTNLDYAGSFTLTFTASDGINQATNAASFSLAFTVTDSKYSAFLLKTDNTATDNQVDASSNSLTITENGNVTSTAFTPYHPKGYSHYFDGSDDYLSLTTSGDLQALGRSGQECTIEAWVYVVAAPTNYGTGIYSQGTEGSSSGTNVLSFEIENDMTVRAIVNGAYTSTTGCPLSTGTVSLGVWTHLALVLYNQTWTIYINGNADGTATGSYPSGTTHNTAYIGRVFAANVGGVERTTEMYIRDLRVTSTAEYTSNFTPPTESLTAVTGTELLTCQDAYLVDNSTNSFDITTNGGAATKTFTPYNHGAYSRSSHGGSVYFDGTGDYISAPFSNNLVQWWTDDFTLEMWVYPNTLNQSVNNVSTACGNLQTDGTTNYWSFGPMSNGTIRFYYWNGAVNFVDTTNTVSEKTWAHLALTFDYSSSTIKIYINGNEEASATLSGTPEVSSSYDLIIGHGSGTGFDGQISDFRIVKGSAVYTSNFTPPTAPLTAITNTQLLTCTNKNSVWDAATGSANLLPSGGTLSTSITKYENESIQLDGVDDYIKIDYTDPLFDVSTGDFTWEGWFRFNNVNSSPKIFISLASGTVYWQLYAYQAKLTFRVNSSGNLYGQAAAELSNSTWYHIALVREGSNFTVYQDGTSVITDTDSGSIGNHISYGIGGPSTRLDGNVEGVRLSKYARYTSNFTPPTGSLEG